MQGYNALYKSGTYCIQLSGPKTTNPRTARPHIDVAIRCLVPDTWNQEDKRLSVISVDLPMIGGPPKIYRRADGVRCVINIYKIEESRPQPAPERRDYNEVLSKNHWRRVQTDRIQSFPSNKYFIASDLSRLGYPLDS